MRQEKKEEEKKDKKEEVELEEVREEERRRRRRRKGRDSLPSSSLPEEALTDHSQEPEGKALPPTSLLPRPFWRILKRILISEFRYLALRISLFYFLFLPACFSLSFLSFLFIST